jgi:hypothetical protein
MSSFRNTDILRAFMTVKEPGFSIPRYQPTIIPVATHLAAEMVDRRIERRNVGFDPSDGWAGQPRRRQRPVLVVSMGAPVYAMRIAV